METLSSGKGLRVFKESRDIVYQCFGSTMLVISGDVVMELFPEPLDDIVIG